MGLFLSTCWPHFVKFSSLLDFRLWEAAPHSFNRLLIPVNQTKQKEIKRSGGVILTLQM